MWCGVPVFRLCAVVVVLGHHSSEQQVYNIAGVLPDGNSAYITAAWDEDDIYRGGVPIQITIGDYGVYIASVRGTTMRFTNRGLSFNTRYSIFTFYDIRNDFNDSGVSQLCRVRTPEMMCISLVTMLLRNRLHGQVPVSTFTQHMHGHVVSYKIKH